jgi:hypothetical protein
VLYACHLSLKNVSLSLLRPSKLWVSLSDFNYPSMPLCLLLPAFLHSRLGEDCFLPSYQRRQPSIKTRIYQGSPPRSDVVSPGDYKYVLPRHLVPARYLRVSKRPVGIWRPELPGACVALTNMGEPCRCREECTARNRGRNGRGTEQKARDSRSVLLRGNGRDRDGNNNMPDPVVW